MSGTGDADVPVTWFGPTNDGRKSEFDEVSLFIPDLNFTIKNWTSYEFSTDWSEANSRWTCTIADGNFQILQQMVQNGHRITFNVNGNVQCTGYVDRWTVDSSRTSGGSRMTISGRDALSPACDSCIDPKTSFDDKKTIKQTLQTLFSPFGFTDISIDDSLNLQRLTGINNIKVQPSFRTQLDIELKKSWRPHSGEGIYAFVERLGRRLGFHVWASSDGKTLYCGQPDYTTPCLGSLVHKNAWTASNRKNSQGYGNDVAAEATQTNVLSSKCSIDWHQQPSVLIATGAGYSATQAVAGLRVFMVNELLVDSSNEPAPVKALREKYKKNTKFLEPRSYIKRPDQIQSIDALNFTKLAIVHDDESKDYAHLANFALNAMSGFQSKFLEVEYTVLGHSQITPSGKMVWTPNTMVQVHDDVNGIYGPMWIKSRTFRKDRSSGTITELRCLLPYTYELHSEPLNTSADQKQIVQTKTRPVSEVGGKAGSEVSRPPRRNP